MSDSVSPELFNKAKEYALRCISYRPRTSWEMSRKLRDKGYDEEIITLVMAFLKDYSFIDDTAFSQMWLRSRTSVKLSGRRRICDELKQKRVDKDIIDQCLAGLSPEKEEEMAYSLIERKCRKSCFDYNKLQGFLIRRGFSLTTIKKVLAQYEKNPVD